jgi:hypothetical protein
MVCEAVHDVVETTYDDVFGLQFERVGFQPFVTEPLAVNKCTVGTFDVLNIDLEKGVILVCQGRKMKQVGNYLSVLFPYFGMLPAENL